MTNHTIIKTFFQTTAPPLEDMLCAICNNLASRDEMTAGPYDADGNLTFICNDHMRNSHHLISSLADYITLERVELIRLKQTNPKTKKATPDAWFLY